MYYVNLFFIYAILGYLFETTTMFLLHKKYNSSVLYGPWTPIYGIAILFMIVVYFVVQKLKCSKKKEIIVYFICITLLLTLLEGISGYIIQITQNKIYWNYDHLKFHLGHYMALEISLIWGIVSTFTMYYLIPKTKKVIQKIPKIVTIIFLTLFIIDILISAFL